MRPNCIAPRPSSTGGHDPGLCCQGMSALTLWMLGYADQVLQRSQEALAQAVMAVAREHGVTQWFVAGIVRRGWALAAQGHRATGARADGPCI